MAADCKDDFSVVPQSAIFAIAQAYFTRLPLKNPALVVFCLMLAVSPCSVEF
jgi:hypothetical protein